MATEKKDSKQEETPLSNVIKVGGNRRTEAYVKIAESLFLNFDEIILGGLGNSKSPSSFHLPHFAS
jgi:hypothetical protein